jgi:hypothetical protein
MPLEALIRLAEEFRQQPEDLVRIQTLSTAVDLVVSLPFEVVLWEPQNIYYEAVKRLYPTFRTKVREHDEEAQNWLTHFRALGKKLRLAVSPADGFEL